LRDHAAVGRRQPDQRWYQQDRAHRREGIPLRLPIQTQPVHQLHGNCGTCNAKTNAGEVDAKFAAKIVTDEPVKNEAGAQQHAGSAGGAGDVAGYGPNDHV